MTLPVFAFIPKLAYFCCFLERFLLMHVSPTAEKFASASPSTCVSFKTPHKNTKATPREGETQHSIASLT